MPVRRALAALLALPVLASIYLAVLLHRGPATRVALGLGAGLAILVAAVSVPAGTIGVPTATQAPLSASALGPTVAGSRELRAAALIDFDAPMDAASVAAAVRVDPPADVTLGWSADGQRLTVTPRSAWRSSTLYTVTVGTAARDREGRALASPVRAAFLTRDLTGGSIAVANRTEKGVSLDSAVTLSFERPVAVADVLRSFRITPGVPGQLLVVSDGPDNPDESVADTFLWEPADAFDGDTRYRVELAAGVLDAEGSPIADLEPLVFRTTTAPSVVRFRPIAGTEDVPRNQVVSVRFTRPMDRESTARAFRVEVNGRQVAGSVDFAEDDTVLVFDPKATFPYGATVILRVGAGAIAADGSPIAIRRAATFTVVEKPRPAATPKPRTTSSPTSRPRATPRPTSSAARPPSSSSLAAEKYLLTLMNRERAKVGASALTYHQGVSDRVARPYAKKLVIANVCSHFYGGTVYDRLRAAGYTGSNYGENLGCRYFADPRDAAESLVRFFLGSPGHYANMVNRGYDYAGIGLWSAGGRLRFVVVFYTP